MNCCYPKIPRIFSPGVKFRVFKAVGGGLAEPSKTLGVSSAWWGRTRPGALASLSMKWRGAWYERRLKMAGGWKKGRINRDPFPEIPGMPNRSELMKPLIFPNNQRGFKIFTVVATVGESNFSVNAHIRLCSHGTGSKWFRSKNRAG